jgi:hypothetical protein
METYSPYHVYIVAVLSKHHATTPSWNLEGIYNDIPD